MGALLQTAAVGSVAGYAGSQALAKVSTLIYEQVSDENKKKEQAIESDPPMVVMARKLASLQGKTLSEKQEKEWAKYLDYALSIGTATAYVAVARRMKLGWFKGGIAFGALYWALFDEAIGPALGLVGDNSEYPLEAHLRGLASHVAFGLAAAAVTTAFGVSRSRS